MSKKITLVRHAKSSWNYHVDDKDRPLLERGINDAHLVSKHLYNKIRDVDAIFSSPANRALHTAAIFTRNLNIPLNLITITNELYDFGGNRVLEFLKSMDNKIDNVMIFGHNHAFTAIANNLGNIDIDNVTTSGVVIIKFDDVNWNSIKTGTTESITFPKHLR